MALLEEVKAKTKEFYTDSYSMSIGEIISLYKDKEIIINPGFQRNFRWTIDQKSRFIESILLGIPIPSIFVYQREEDSVWELVDGLQRIATILEFVGELRDDKDETGETKKDRLILKGTKLLPSLEGIQWEGSENREQNLPPPLRLDFKRAKILVQIIQKDSNKNAKFEVFDRLNTGGSFLSYQEVRNSLLIMLDKSFYQWLVELAKNENFKNCTPMSDRLKEECYDMELILKYLAFSDPEFDPKEVNRKDVNGYLTDYLTKLCDSQTFDRDLEKRKFEKIFSLLYRATGEETFTKYFSNEDRFKGKFLDSAYEAITIGLKDNIDNYSDSDIELLKTKIKEMWSKEEFTSYIGSGTNAKTRVPKMIEFGKNHFKKQ